MGRGVEVRWGEEGTWVGEVRWDVKVTWGHEVGM